MQQKGTDRFKSIDLVKNNMLCTVWEESIQLLKKGQRERFVHACKKKGKSKLKKNHGKNDIKPLLQ